MGQIPWFYMHEVSKVCHENGKFFKIASLKLFMQILFWKRNQVCFRSCRWKGSSNWQCEICLPSSCCCWHSARLLCSSKTFLCFLQLRVYCVHKLVWHLSCLKDHKTEFVKSQFHFCSSSFLGVFGIFKRKIEQEQHSSALDWTINSDFLNHLLIDD